MFYFYGLAKGSMIYLSRWHKNTSLRHAVVLSMAPVTDCHRDIHGRPVVPGQMDLLTERYISHPVFVWISTWAGYVYVYVCVKRVPDCSCHVLVRGHVRALALSSGREWT